MSWIKVLIGALQRRAECAGNNDNGNSMPEIGENPQAVECLADIRRRSGASSEILVFDFEQLNGGNEQESITFPLSSPEIEHLAHFKGSRPIANCVMHESTIN